MTDDAKIPRRLVIADDSAEMRWFLRSSVGEDFAEICEATDGRELFWTLLRADFDDTDDERGQVVVTDLCMPGYGTLDVVEVWRALRPSWRMILITAFPSDAVTRRARKLGIEVLAKPFSITALRGLIRRVCSPGGST